MIETYRGVVYPYHLDHMGHMNVQWYAAKFDEATWQFFARLGVTPGYIRERERGMAAVEQLVRYRREVRAGDVLVIRTRVLEIREKSVRFLHVMSCCETGDEVASCEQVAVHLDRAARRACRFPEEIRERGRELAGEG